MMLVSSLVVLLTLSYSSAQRITCASLNVDSTKQFQNCVSRVLGSAGMITAGDQFTSCGSMVANQARYLECVCTKSEHLADCYNQYCPGDGSAAQQSQNKARYCAAYTSAAVQPASTTYSLPAIPTLASYAALPTMITPAPAPVPTTKFKLPDEPSAAPAKWNPTYITVFMSMILGIVVYF